MAVTLEINEALFAQIDKELAAIGVFHRQPILKTSFKKALDITAQRYKDSLPMPGYPGDKKGKVPLRNTVKTKVKEYGNGALLGVVGAEWTTGRHAHLVEEGHEIVTGGTSPNPKNRKTPAVSKRTAVRGGGSIRGRVEGGHHLAKAVKATQGQVDNAILAGVREAIEKAKAGA